MASTTAPRSEARRLLKKSHLRRSASSLVIQRTGSTPQSSGFRLPCIWNSLNSLLAFFNGLLVSCPRNSHNAVSFCNRGQPPIKVQWWRRFFPDIGGCPRLRPPISVAVPDYVPDYIPPEKRQNRVNVFLGQDTGQLPFSFAI